MITVEERSWRVAVSDDATAFAVPSAAEPLRMVVATDGTTVLPSSTCTVEALWRISGMMPHALVAATFAPSIERELRVEVVVGPEFSLAGPATPGPLGAPPLVPGLPHEFAAAVLDAIREAAVPTAAHGHVQVVGGGVDADSSAMMFRLCGRLLMAVASARSVDAPVDEAIRRLLAATG